MPDYAMRADVRAMPDTPDHPDAAVFAAVRAIAAAEAAHNLAIERAGEQGRDLEDGEQGEFHAAYRAALSALDTCAPVTAAGARAMLKGLAALDFPDPQWLSKVLGETAACPALACRA